MSAVYHNQQLTVPVCYELVTKPLETQSTETGKTKRQSETTKNEHLRNLVLTSVKNDILFKFVLADSWYSSAENIIFIKLTCKKDFIFAVKTNRTVALSAADAKKRIKQPITSLGLEPGQTRKIWLEGVSFPVLIVKEVYVNKDQSVAEQYLITSDLTLDYQSIISLYPQRWKIETYHKSLKQNDGIGNSPTKTPKTQSNHLFASLCAYIKVESLRIIQKTNHFALKTKIYYNALIYALKELKLLETNQNSNLLGA